MKTTLYLTRHGQTEWNTEGRFQGHQDSPLTTLGLRQGQWLSERMMNVDIDRIYSSPSGRARHTAELIRGERDIPIMESDSLREINMGAWEGKLITEIQSEFPQDYNAFWNAPHLFQAINHGETFFDVRKRVIPWIEEIVNNHKGGAILVVTHAATLKTMLNFFQRKELSEIWEPPFINPTALCKVFELHGHYEIEIYGDTSHYKDI